MIWAVNQRGVQNMIDVRKTGKFIAQCRHCLLYTSLTLGIISFAYSTVLGWAYYGERCVEYFAGKKVLLLYRCLYVAVAVIAPVVALDLVWLIADTLNALMAIPNLVAVLLLSNVIISETKKYINDLDAKDDTPIPVIKD